MRSPISYSSGYEYQLQSDCWFDTYINLPEAIYTEYITLLPLGQLILRDGYAWNGPNFPAIHTRQSIIASLPHDALYQLISLGLLTDDWRKQADYLLASIVSAPVEGELFLNKWRKIRGKYYFYAVDRFGCKYAHSVKSVVTV